MFSIEIINKLRLPIICLCPRCNFWNDDIVSGTVKSPGTSVGGSVAGMGTKGEGTDRVLNTAVAKLLPYAVVVV